jgi:flagellar motor switch protein FliN/FliY
METPLTLEAVASAFADDLVAACSSRLGGESTVAPSEVPVTPGWTLTVAVSGPVTGSLVVWIDRQSAQAAARVTLGAEATTDAAIAGLLVAIVKEASATTCAREGWQGLAIGPPAVGQGVAASAGRSFYIAVANTASCFLSVGVDRTPARPVNDRLDAVLGVDLPLVVRFGRTVLPLRTIADLGPGSLIDMGRSPEEPVDLLVGDRLIARGEVVVVGGNYGVRITELATGREPAAPDWEARGL